MDGLHARVQLDALAGLGVIDAAVDGHGHEIVGVDEVLNVAIDWLHLFTCIEGVHDIISLAVLDAQLMGDRERVFDRLDSVHKRRKRLQSVI